jgi:predicted outer membrane repeat protein
VAAYRSIGLGLVTLGVGAVCALPAAAAGVVGNGTPASCTEAAFNAALTGGGTVTFNCGSGAVIPITATKTLTTTTTIDGSGQSITLDGGGTTRMFGTTYQFASFTLTFRWLTLRNGRALDFGGAIRLAFQDNLTTLNIENVTFQNNVCDQAGPDVGGGALYAQGGIVTIRNSTFAGNRGGNGGAIGNLQARFTIEDTLFTGNATNAAGSGGGNGGAIYIDGSNFGQLVIRRSAFTSNLSTLLGGAIHTYLYAGGSGMTIEDTTFQGNSTQQNGGAIYHQNGSLSIARSTFASNTTRGQGGALWLLQAAPTTIANSTFDGNQATGIAPNVGSSGLGGAILINASNTVTISHTTITNNHADWVGGGITGGMGSSSTTLRGTIVAYNTASNGGNPWNIGHNCSGQLLDGGGNLQFPARNPSDSNDHNCTAVVTIADPLLVPLAMNGGYTQTRALPAGSPARNVLSSGCPPPATDQRGVARPQGPGCDAGAYEAAPAIAVASLVVTEGSGGATSAVFNVSLSEANTLPVTVAYATANGSAISGSDYIATSGTLVFSPGQTARTISVQVIPDLLDEDDETFTLGLSAPSNAILSGSGVATATIIDDDPAPALSVSDCIALEGTGTGGACVFTISLSAESGKGIAVQYATLDASATAPGDYAATAGTLAFAPGVTSRTVSVSLVGDALDETDEVFVLNLSSAVNAGIADGQGTATIDDDDGPSISASSPSVVEGNSGDSMATFVLTLSAPSVQAVAVPFATADGTATAGSDYQTVTGTAMFSVGSTSQSIQVPVHGDVAAEPNERFSLELGPATDGTLVAASALATIINDDGGTWALTELQHGAQRRLAVDGAGTGLFLALQPARSSWELVLDEASGDLGAGNGPGLTRVAPDLTTVLQTAVAVGAGPARVLRWQNATSMPQGNYVRVQSAGCTTDCGPDDVYRLRAYETTGRIARFSAAAGQTTVLVLQNPSSYPVAGTAFFWSSGGALLGSQAVALNSHGSLVLSCASVPGVAGQSGSITVVHDGGYGALAGKAVGLDPAGGFSFDTPLLPRPY